LVAQVILNPTTIRGLVFYGLGYLHVYIMKDSGIAENHVFHFKYVITYYTITCREDEQINLCQIILN
jgi:hypothetical protein